MKTVCYAIYCSKHPLYNQRNSLKVLTGWRVGDYIPLANKNQGVEVDCLEPLSDAFDELDIIAEDEKFPTTVYNDGGSETGFDTGSYEVRAFCGNEDYEGKTS